MENKITHVNVNFIQWIIICLTALGMSGCTKNIKPDETTVPSSASTKNPPAEELSSRGDSDSGQALGLHTIHFSYDSEDLNSEVLSELQANAKILAEHPGIKVQIEGHCDQRGGIQYNLALGDRRAKAVKDYLVDHGINNNRLTTISYGKEHLVDLGESEEAYAKNRRANFVLTEK